MAKKTDTKIVSTPPTPSAAHQTAGQMAALPTTGQGEFLLYQTEDAQTRVQVATLDEHWNATLAPPGEGSADADAGHAHLRDALTAAGLDDAERDAFLSAWSEALFGETLVDPAPSGVDTLQVPGGSATPLGGAGDVPPNPRAPRPHPGHGGAGLVGNLSGGGGLGFHHALGSVPDALIYLVPEDTVSELLPLELSPAPRSVSRVFLARIELVALRGGLMLEEVRARGGLSRDEAGRVVRQHAAPLGECVTGAPASTMFAELRILTTGAVERASLAGRPLDARQTRCFVDHLRSIQFAESDAVTELTVRFSVNP